MTKRLFIFGLGYSGLEIARVAAAAGWGVAGTVTTVGKARRLAAEGIDAYPFDGTAPPAPGAFDGASHVLCTIPPGTAGDPALRICAPQLRDARWLGYLSTTGVYGDHDGRWVDETTPPCPDQPRSIARLAAERAWQAMGATVFRLPGIYGPGRSAIDRVKAGTAQRIDKPGHLFSRIHVGDIAAAVITAAARPSSGAIYNVVDDLPASNSDVIAYACDLLGRPVPPTIPWDEAAPMMSAMARSFYVGNRRVRNDRLKRDLGVTLRYPTYREGLRAIAAGSHSPLPLLKRGE
jgi:hypothetical protein